MRDRSGGLSSEIAGPRQTMTSRRSVLAGGAGLVAFAWGPWVPGGIRSSSEAAAQTSPAEIPAPPPNGIAVTLLGTGTPALRPDRWGPSTLVEANGKLLVFDAGRGCAVHVRVGLARRHPAQLKGQHVCPTRLRQGPGGLAACHKSQGLTEAARARRFARDGKLGHGGRGAAIGWR